LRFSDPEAEHLMPMTKRLRPLPHLAMLFALLLASNGHAVPTPKYLAIEHFEKCLATQQHPGHRSWCMPARPSAACPEASWRQLTGLEKHEKLPECPTHAASSSSSAASAASASTPRTSPDQAPKR